MKSGKPSASPPLAAVIDLGSSAARMVIAEVSPDGSIRVIESLNKPVALGKDVFVSRRISRAAALEAIEILQGFTDLMRQYRVTNCRAVGTSALREAADRETFLDRIYMRTGIEVEVIEGIEENRLVYGAVQKVLGDRLAEEDAFLIEVGSGDTDITLLRKGKVVMAHTIRSGSLRLLRERGDLDADRAAAVRGLRQRVKNAAEGLSREFALGHVENYVALGSEARFLAGRVGKDFVPRCAAVAPEDFRRFLRHVAAMSPDDIVEELNIPYADAETLVPALIIYERFLQITTPTRILVPMVSMRDGLLLEMADMLAETGESDFTKQILASAQALGQKYRYDEAHALHVTQMAMSLFDFTQEDHGLGRRERALMEVAAVLHDIGTFVSASGHHKHGQYLVKNSEIFGLRRNDLAIVGNVVRYHRRALPDTRHPEYAPLSREDRVKVSKLAAILRVADALDRGHRQHVRRLSFRSEGDDFTINVGGNVDLSLERAGLPGKADLFAQVFGYDVVLRNTWSPAAGNA